MSTGTPPAARPTSNRKKFTLSVAFVTPYTSPFTTMFDAACVTPEWTTSWLFWVVKKPAPNTTYENTAATTTNAISTIAASSPVNASSLLNFFICYTSQD